MRWLPLVASLWLFATGIGMGIGGDTGGQVVRFDLPPGVRCDTWVERGTEVIPPQACQLSQGPDKAADLFPGVIVKGHVGIGGDPLPV